MHSVDIHNYKGPAGSLEVRDLALQYVMEQEDDATHTATTLLMIASLGVKDSDGLHKLASAVNEYREILHPWEAKKRKAHFDLMSANARDDEFMNKLIENVHRGFMHADGYIDNTPSLEIIEE